MNQFDKELVNKLFELSKKTLKIYYTLYTLEITNQKDSEIYKKNLNYLDMLIEMENELYQKVPIEKINTYLKYSDRLNNLANVTDFTIILNEFTDLYFVKRVFNRLKEIKRLSQIEQYQEEDKGKDMILFSYRSIYEDMLKTFLFEIEKAKNSNDNYKNDLTMIKYIVSYLDLHIEKRLKDNFNIEDSLMLTFKSNQDIFEINDFTFHRILKTYFNRYIAPELENIEKNNETSQDDSFKYRPLLIKAFIKSFSIFDEEKIFLNHKFNDMIDTKDNDDGVVILRTKGW